MPLFRINITKTGNRTPEFSLSGQEGTFQDSAVVDLVLGQNYPSITARLKDTQIKAVKSFTPAGNPQPAANTFWFASGDSNTDGGEAPDNAYFTDPGKSYFSLISARLGMAAIEGTSNKQWSSTQWRSFNDGTGGATSVGKANGLAARLDAQWDRAAYPQAVVSFMLGTNDVANNVTLEQTKQAFRSLRGQLNGIPSGDKVKLIVIPGLEPGFHQTGPAGRQFYQDVADFVNSEWNTTIQADGVYNLRANPLINRLVTKTQAPGWGLTQNQDYWALEMFGGPGGTGNGGVDFDAFHWGNLGHEEFATRFQPVLVGVAGGPATPGNITPAAPGIAEVQDTEAGGSFRVVPVANVPLVHCRYKFASSTEGIQVPANGIVDVGNIAGIVTVYSVAFPGYNQSPPRETPAFTQGNVVTVYPQDRDSAALSYISNGNTFGDNGTARETTTSGDLVQFDVTNGFRIINSTGAQIPASSYVLSINGVEIGLPTSGGTAPGGVIYAEDYTDGMMRVVRLRLTVAGRKLTIADGTITLKALPGTIPQGTRENINFADETILTYGSGPSGAQWLRNAVSSGIIYTNAPGNYVEFPFTLGATYTASSNSAGGATRIIIAVDGVTVYDGPVNVGQFMYKTFPSDGLPHVFRVTLLDGGGNFLVVDSAAFARFK